LDTATPVQLVVFDLDGTLVDSSGDLAQAVNATLARLDPRAEPLSLASVRRFVGNGARSLVTRSLQARSLSTPVDQALALFLELYGACLLDTTHLYPGVVEALDALCPRRLAVLTNKPGDMSRTILRGLGVAERFQHILGAGDVPAHKPDPAGLLALLERASVSAQAAVMVGDSAVDVRTGRAAGVRTIGVRYGLDPDGLREHPPDILLDDLRDLPRVIG